MLELSDLQELELEIKFPSDLKNDFYKFSSGLSLDKILVNSFPTVSISARKILDKFKEEFPYISLFGNHGIFTLGQDNIEVSVTRHNDRFLLTNADTKKDEDLGKVNLASLGSDINYLIGSILGSLNLSDKALKTEIRLEFSKDNIFKKPFVEKINKETLKKLSIKDVPRISLTVEDSDKTHKNGVVIYDFVRSESEEIKVIEKFEKVFSPLDIPILVEKFIRELNKVLEGW